MPSLVIFFLIGKIQAQTNCINIDCGTIQANWELLEGKEAIVCEGDDFQLRGAESTPLNNISEFHWCFIEAGSGRVLFDTIKFDTSHVNFNYVVTDSLACESSSVIPLEVTLVVTSLECSDGKRSCNYKTSSLIVNLRPRARFSTIQEVCINTTFNPNNLSCHGTEFLWDFGDGTTSTEESPTHQYTNTGEYTISLTAINGCGQTKKSQKIRVVGFPEANVSYELDPTNACLPTTGIFIDQSNEWSKTEWFITPKHSGQWMFTDKDTVINDWYFRTDTTAKLSNFDTLHINYKQAGEYTVRLVADNVCEMLDEKTEIINIYKKPDIKLSSPGSFCDSRTISFADVALDTSGTITEFSWTFENGTPGSFNGYAFPDVTFNQSGEITLQISSPCGDVTKTVPIIIGTTDPITFPATNPTEICPQGDSIQLKADPPFGSWTGLANAQNAISADGWLNPKLLPATPNNTYTLVYSNGAQDCPNLDSIEIKVTEAVTVDLMEEPAACKSLEYTPNVLYSGEIDSYLWSFNGTMPGSSTIKSPGPISYPSPDTSLVIVEVTGECGTAIDSIQIKVQADTDLVITPLPGPLCTGSAPETLEVNVVGGEWSGTGINSEGVFDPGGVSQPGNYPIMYQLDDGACNNTANIAIEVVQSLNITAQDELICIDTDSIQLEVDHPGGTWSGDGVSSNGIFTPPADGVFTVRYLLTDSNNCDVSAESVITVEQLPVLSLNKDTVDLCLSEIDLNAADVLAYTATDFSSLSGMGTTIWSSPNVNITSSGDFNTGELDEGFYTLYVQYDRNQCSVMDSAIVRVVQAGELVISPDASVCVTDGFLQLETNLGGGRWSGGPEIDLITGQIDLAMAAESMVSTIREYTYTFQEGTNCEQSQTVQVEIIDLSQIVQAGPDEEICEGPNRYTLLGASPGSGYWVGTGIDRLSGEIDLSQLQLDTDYTFQYCIETDRAEACEACDNRTFRINANPVADFSVNEFVCIEQNIGLENQSQNAVRYYWDFGDNSTYTEILPGHEYAQKQLYTIELIVESERGSCRDTTTRTTYATTPAAPNFILDSDQGCAPFPINLTNTSLGDSITYVWHIDEKTIPGENPGEVILDSIMEDTYFPVVLAATNLCGEVRHTDSILVHPYPIVDFSVSEDEGCSPLLIEFSNTTLVDPDRFFWEMGDNSTYTDVLPPDKRYYTSRNSVATYTITLRAENECGADTLSKNITVYPPDVEAFIELDTLKGCTPLTFTPQSYSTPGAEVSWKFIAPDGEMSGSDKRNPELTLKKAGVHTIVLYASNCGTDTDTAYVEVLSAPEASFTHHPYVCLGQPIEFENNSENISGSEWDFGDSTVSDEHSPAHVYTSIGIETITLTVYSLLNNCPATYASVLEVIGNPEAEFIPSITNGCGPLNVQFENLSSGVGELNYVWNYGDGGSGSTEKNSPHRFEDPGEYIISLTAYDDFGCFADTAIANILVYDDPVSQFSFEDKLYCLGYDEVQLIDESTDALSYEWTFQGMPSSEGNPVFIPASGGVFPIELIVENAFGCRDRSVQQIEILEAPVAAFSADQTQGCEDFVVHFENQSTSSNLFSWAFDLDNGSTDPSPTHIFLNPGTFEVLLTAASTNGCPEDTARTEIIVRPKPTAAFAYEKPQECGAPAQVIFTNNSTGNRDSDWDFGDTYGSNNTNPIHTYNNIGLFPVTLIITNDVGCRDTIDQDIDIYGQPTAGFTYPAEGCQPLNLNMINTSTESLRYIFRLWTKKCLLAIG